MPCRSEERRGAPAGHWRRLFCVAGGAMPGGRRRRSVARHWRAHFARQAKGGPCEVRGPTAGGAPFFFSLRIWCESSRKRGANR